jgi:hypothetical protein
MNQRKTGSRAARLAPTSGEISAPGPPPAVSRGLTLNGVPVETEETPLLDAKRWTQLRRRTHSLEPPGWGKRRSPPEVAP